MATMSTASMVAVVLAAGAAALAPDAGSAETTLKVVPQADVRVLDPYVNNAGITTVFAYMVYDNLLTQDAAGMTKPQMVESWSVSPDGLTYTFTLRPNLKFSDGQPVKS